MIIVSGCESSYTLKLNFSFFNIIGLPKLSDDKENPQYNKDQSVARRSVITTAKWYCSYFFNVDLHFQKNLCTTHLVEW